MHRLKSHWTTVQNDHPHFILDFPLFRWEDPITHFWQKKKVLLKIFLSSVVFLLFLLVMKSHISVTTHTDNYFLLPLASTYFHGGLVSFHALCKHTNTVPGFRWYCDIKEFIHQGAEALSCIPSSNLTLNEQREGRLIPSLQIYLLVFTTFFFPLFFKPQFWLHWYPSGDADVPRSCRGSRKHLNSLHIQISIRCWRLEEEYALWKMC